MLIKMKPCISSFLFTCQTTYMKYNNAILCYSTKTRIQQHEAMKPDPMYGHDFFHMVLDHEVIYSQILQTSFADVPRLLTWTMYVPRLFFYEQHVQCFLSTLNPKSYYLLFPQSLGPIR